MASDGYYAAIMGGALGLGGGLTMLAPMFDWLSNLIIRPEDGDKKRRELIQKFNAFMSALGVAMILQGMACFSVYLGYPDLATYADLATGVRNIYVFANIAILPLLMCMLATATNHHVSVYLPLVFLSALQGGILYALSSVSIDITAYSLLTTFYGLLGILPLLKLLLSGEMFRDGDGLGALLGRMVTLVVLSIVMILAWLFVFLTYNVEHLDTDQFLWAPPAYTLGLFAILAVAGVVLVYDRSGANALLPGSRKNK